MNPDQLRRQAARERAAAERAQARSQVHLSRAQLLEETADQLDRLSHGHESVTTDRDMAQEQIVTREKRGAGRPIASKGPVAKVAKALGVSMSEVAKLLGVTPEAARQWDSRGTVPEQHRQALAALKPKK